MDRKKQIALPLFLFIAYLAFATIYLYPRSEITNLDFWYHISLGQHLIAFDISTLVDGFYPLGLPLIIRSGLNLGMDALRVSQVASVVGGLLAIIAIGLIIFSATQHILIASAGAILLLTNWHFLHFSTFEGTDMLAAGLQLAACAALFIEIQQQSDDGHSTTRMSFFVGSLLGAGYLVRYSALSIVPVILFSTIISGKSFKFSPKKLLALTVGFILVSSLQTIPSVLQTGNPFFNLQAKNVWFAHYGEWDWSKNWSAVPDTISLLEVVSLDFGRFFNHWQKQFIRGLFYNQFWPSPMHYLALFSLFSLLSETRIKFAGRFLLIGVWLVTILATSLAWVDVRLMLVPLIIQGGAIAIMIDRFGRILAKHITFPTYLAAPAILLLAFIINSRPTSEFLSQPVNLKPQAINGQLRLNGLDNANQVLTNNIYLHQTDNIARTQYLQTSTIDGAGQTINHLLHHPDMEEVQYVVLDYEDGTGKYQIDSARARTPESRLVPINLGDQLDIFCISPCANLPRNSADYRLENGMHLDTYSIASNDSGTVVYLDWTTSSVMTEDFKVSIRILNSHNEIIEQIDNVPQQWLHPTSNWQAESKVVDVFFFEGFQLNKDGDSVQVVVYHSGTSQPVQGTTSATDNTFTAFPLD